jgi:cardiolipin-specific phospholipase
MDLLGGRASVENLRKAGNGEARTYVVNNAGSLFFLWPQCYNNICSGHHLYLDNPKAVNDLIIRELDRPSAK